MSDPIRELIASFVVEVDRAGELARGNEAVTALKAKLTELQDAFKHVKAPAEQAGKAVADVFTRALQQAKQSRQAMTALSAFGGGRADNTGFGDAFAQAAGRTQQVGPTRETMEQGRAQMAVADAAAKAYSQTLRGKLKGAIDAVRAGFRGGGGSGGGPGLIDSLATVRNGMLALGASVVVGRVKGLVDSIGSIGEGAAKLGVTNAQFQRLRVLAAQSDTSVQALGGAFRNLANAAAQPTTGTAAAFERLGVSTKDASGQFKSSNELFWEVSRALAGIGNETERSALAQDLLGRGAQDLKAIFSSGADAVDRQRIALEKLGVLSDETIKNADEASDMWAGFGLAMLAAAEPLLKVLLPALVQLTEWVLKVIDVGGKWLKSTDLTAAALTALGVALYWKVIPGIQLMIGLGGGLTKVLLGMTGAAVRATLTFMAWAIPLALIEDSIGFLMGNESAIGNLFDKLLGKGSSADFLKTITTLYRSLAASVKYVLDLLGLRDRSEGDKAEASGLVAYGKSLVAANRAMGPRTLDEAAAVEQGQTLDGYRDMQRGFLAYGPPTATGSKSGNAPLPNVINVDTTLTFNGVRPGDGKAIAADLDQVLERSRDAIVAQVP